MRGVSLNRQRLGRASGKGAYFQRIGTSKQLRRLASVEIPSSEEIWKYLQSEWKHQRPIKQGTVNGVRVSVCRDGVDHPSPTCLQATKDWAGGFFSLRRSSLPRYRLELWATGSSPRARYWYTAGLLNLLPELSGERAWHFLNNRLFISHGDNYMGIPNHHPDSFVRYFMENFFDRLDMPSNRLSDFLGFNCHFIDGSNTEKRLRRDYSKFLSRVGTEVNQKKKVHYNQLRKKASNLEIVEWLGWGPGGHIWFNEPHHHDFAQRWWGVVSLSDETKTRTDVDYVTQYERAFTLMGMPTLMLPHQIKILINKTHFADLVHKVFTEPYEKQADEFIPARELMHPDVKPKTHYYLSEGAADGIMDLIQEAA